MTKTACYPSPVGMLTLAAEGECLTGLWIGGQRYHGRTLLADACPGDTPLLREAAAWLDAYFAGKRPDPRVLCPTPMGSEFARQVWDALVGIPYGRCISYGELARSLGSSPRAVGGAVGRNPISIVIPCHRVVGADGALTGYAGGTAAKEWLLRHEGWLR